MAKQPSPLLGFWGRQLLLVCVVIALAMVIIFLYESYQGRPVPDGGLGKRSIQSGLTNFYREYRNTFDDQTAEAPSDFVLEVTPSNIPLAQRLNSMSQNVKAVPPNWQGTHTQRSFRPGASLREAMTIYAKQEGVRLVWDLEQDFVVKHQFQTEGTLASALVEMSTAIDSNFEKRIMVYRCPEARALVITTQQSEALDEQCQRLRSR